jgi:ABC-type glutathione transport system ATPase component
LGLAFYLSLVIPSEFGVPRPWHFPVTDLYRKYTGVKAVTEVEMSVEEAVEKLEDADVKAERDRIDAKEYAEDSPLIINHLRKIYPARSGLGPKIAVRDITLAAEKGVVLGLLGPNGGLPYF